MDLPRNAEAIKQLNLPKEAKDMTDSTDQEKKLPKVNKLFSMISLMLLKKFIRRKINQSEIPIEQIAEITGIDSKRLQSNFDSITFMEMDLLAQFFKSNVKDIIPFDISYDEKIVIEGLDKFGFDCH